MSTFRAIWPIVDQRIPYEQLIAEATEDLERLTIQAHCRVTNYGAGRWSIARSSQALVASRRPCSCTRRPRSLPSRRGGWGGRHDEVRLVHRRPAPRLPGQHRRAGGVVLRVRLPRRK